MKAMRQFRYEEPRLLLYSARAFEDRGPVRGLGWGAETVSRRMRSIWQVVARKLDIPTHTVKNWTGTRLGELCFWFWLNPVGRRVKGLRSLITGDERVSRGRPYGQSPGMFRQTDFGTPCQR